MPADAQDLSTVIAREIEGFLDRYGFSGSTAVSLLSESENKIYLVEDPARPETYVARVNSGRLAYHTAPSIAAELAWMTALREDTDIVVPEVLRARDGSTVQTLDAADLDKPRHAAVYSFLSGNEPPEDRLVPGFAHLGEISARMLRHAMGWAPPRGFSRHTWSPEAILGNAFHWGRWQDGYAIEGETLTLLSRLEATLRRRLADLPTDRGHHGLIHGDLRLANLLVEGERTAIIDFDDCGFGWYLFDLAGALSFLEERPDAPDLIASWLEGYRRVAAIPAVMEDAIPDLVMLRRLQLIGWVGYQTQHLDFAREIAPRFTADTGRLAEDYLTRCG